MAEIKIYGDIVPFKWSNDGSEYDLKDLLNDLKGLDISENEELIVGIHTFGGCTTTAFGIYNMLQRFKKENKIKLTTRIDGWCASSGTIILMAGDKRIGNKFAEPFVHNAWTWVMGANKHDAEKIYEDLSKVDDQIATLYSDRTTITKDEALQLMDAETFISAEKCLAYGFYTELEEVVAIENAYIFNSLRGARNTKNNPKIMSNKNNPKEGKSGLIQELKNLINTFTSGAKNKIVFTAENEELDFYELDDDATPVVGDKALFNGAPAGDSNDGEYLLVSGETYKFSGEELTEIVPVEESDDDGDDEEMSIEDLKAENESLKNQIADLQNTLNAKTTEAENLATEVSTLNKKVEIATQIAEKFNSLDLSVDEDEDEEDEDPADAINQPRNPKSSTNKVLTRNLFKDIK